jgi:uncharacterized lipoprotein YddW (UPF0748 family)
VDGAPADLLAELKRQGRLQVTDGGATINWLCPSREENLRWEKDAVREIVRGYPVDGIHLDYVRYQNSHACYCAECRRRFEDHLERRLRPWPAAVLKGPLRSEFLRWRCTRITRLVRDVAALARAADGRLRVSAAVYGKYPSCVDGVGQDWVTWLQEGCLDFICPMNYTADLERFTQLTRSQIGLAGSGAKVLPGIGVTATESQLDPAAVIDQIAALRREGAAGFVLFSLNPTLERETLPVLRLGTMADL